MIIRPTYRGGGGGWFDCSETNSKFILPVVNPEVYLNHMNAVT